jgi:molybdate transport system ATP-binding protein
MLMSGEAFRGWTLDVEVPLGERSLDVALETSSSTVAIVGPSGAGKSTLLRVIAGVERRAKGRLVVDGEPWLDSASGFAIPPWERGVGWVPQDASLFPHLTVRENLAYAYAKPEQVREAASLLEVDHLMERRPRRLSGGERQRVALGRALLSSPRLLLLDEPFSALDRPARATLARLVRAWADDRGVPLVLVSHDEEDTDVLAAERWHLAGGTLRVSSGGPPPGPDSPT